MTLATDLQVALRDRAVRLFAMGYSYFGIAHLLLVVRTLEYLSGPTPARTASLKALAAQTVRIAVPGSVAERFAAQVIECLAIAEIVQDTEGPPS